MDGKTRGLASDGRPNIRSLRVETLAGPDKGRSVSTRSERLSIGTAESNDLVLTDETVSRFHLDLLRAESSIRVVDHGSTNGTVHGDVRITEATIPPGAQLRLGNTVVAVHDGDDVAVELHEENALDLLLGRSQAMRRLMASIKQVAKSDASVLILGETGAGKEMVARTIHALGARSKQVFETVDCGAMLPTLMASELFGHERGAFTGAERRHIGAFERADTGTLFLDEIGELPASLQTALLGALDRRQFRRVGGQERIDVDVRLIAATNRDLRAEVNAGQFRPDLYYRLAVVALEVPPLRQRPEDIPLLVASFLDNAGFKGEMSSLFPDRVIEQMQKAHWPGNVRELRNYVESALVMGKAQEPHPPSGNNEPNPPSDTPAGDLPRLEELTELNYEEAKSLLFDAFETGYVGRLLESTGGNVSEAARRAGVHRSYLNRILNRQGIRVNRVTTKREDES